MPEPVVPEATVEEVQADEPLEPEEPEPEVRELSRYVSAFSQRSIEEALERVPPEHDTAFVLYGDADAQEMRIGVVVKIGEQWSFAGDLAREWKGPWSAHGELRFSR